MHYATYGEALRGLRLRLGLTQKVFALAIGLKYQATCSEHERAREPVDAWPELHNGTLAITKAEIGWKIEPCVLLARKIKAIETAAKAKGHTTSTFVAERSTAKAPSAEEKEQVLRLSRLQLAELENINNARLSAGMELLKVRVRSCPNCFKQFEHTGGAYMCPKCKPFQGSATALSGYECIY